MRGVYRQDLSQLDQRLDRNQCWPHGYRGTGRGIDHPPGKFTRDFIGAFDVDNFLTTPTRAPEHTNTLPVKWVPGVLDHHELRSVCTIAFDSLLCTG